VVHLLDIIRMHSYQVFHKLNKKILIGMEWQSVAISFSFGHCPPTQKLRWTGERIHQLAEKCGNLVTPFRSFPAFTELRRTSERIRQLAEECGNLTLYPSFPALPAGRRTECSGAWESRKSW